MMTWIHHKKMYMRNGVETPRNIFRRTIINREMCAHLFNGLLFTIILIVVQSAEMKMVLGDSVIASYQSRRLFSSFGI
jgi:hypothetical protein